MIFGSQRDFKILRGINRELLQDIIEQEILLYKIVLSDTTVNIYGEAIDKVYYNPVKLYTLITRGDQVFNTTEYGPDLTREVSFAFLRDDLTDIQVVPEVGDIIMWREGYFEIDTVRENQLFVGKDENYTFSEYGKKFGESISIICDTHQTRNSKISIQAK